MTSRVKFKEEEKAAKARRRAAAKALGARTKVLAAYAEELAKIMPLPASNSGLAVFGVKIPRKGVPERRGRDRY